MSGTPWVSGTSGVWNSSGVGTPWVSGTSGVWNSSETPGVWNSLGRLPSLPPLHDAHVEERMTQPLRGQAVPVKERRGPVSPG